MRIAIIMIFASLTGACASTGGDILGPDDNSLSSDRAVVVFSAQVADSTRFQSCSVLAGKSAATATWFSWPVIDSDPHLVVLEVPTPDYRFFRFGCAYSGLVLSTSVEGPTVNVRAGEVTYLGRLTVTDTEFGSAAGFKRMPTAIRLSFEDQSEADLARLREKLPLIEWRDVAVDIPERWNSLAMNTLRPYNRGLRVVQAPTSGAFNN
jgi:hypothetical protein